MTLNFFLQKDSVEHRALNNFVLKPEGPIWKNLCEQFGLNGERVASACRIFNSATDPH